MQELELCGLCPSAQRRGGLDLSTSVIAPPTGTGLSFVTLRQEADRVELAVRGCVDGETAPFIALAADGHLRMGRRYLRLDLGAVTAIDEAAVRRIAQLHRRLLAARGTLVLTNVPPSLFERLSEAESGLLMVAPTAADSLSEPAFADGA